jgi:multiple sugar transport system permease protein
MRPASPQTSLVHSTRPVPRQGSPRRRPWFGDYKKRAAFLFLLPALVILIVFSAVPSISALILSFTRWDMMSPVQFTGLSNYKRLATDERFVASFVNTLYYTGVSVPLSVVLSLVVALVLNERWLRGRGAFRVIFFIPIVVSPVAISMIWKWIYNPSFGLLNAFLGFFGVPKQFWDSDPHLAIPSLIVMTVWQTFGYNAVLFLAGLSAIPDELYDAAVVDGANKPKRIRYITLPLLAPTTIFVVVIAVIRSFQVFDQVLVLGGVSGPTKSLVVTVYYLYQAAFQSFKLGYGSAIGIVLFVTILVVAVMQFRYYAQRFER